jgi:hypothetical protein
VIHQYKDVPVTGEAQEVGVAPEGPQHRHPVGCDVEGAGLDGLELVERETRARAHVL